MDDGGRTAPKLRHPPVWPRRAVLRPGGATGRDQGAREVNRTWRLLLRLRSAAQAEEEATATRACSFGGGLSPSRGPGGTLPAPPAILTRPPSAVRRPPSAVRRPIAWRHDAQPAQPLAGV